MSLAADQIRLSHFLPSSLIFFFNSIFGTNDSNHSTNNYNINNTAVLLLKMKQIVMIVIRQAWREKVSAETKSIYIALSMFRGKKDGSLNANLEKHRSLGQS